MLRRDVVHRWRRERAVTGLYAARRSCTASARHRARARRCPGGSLSDRAAQADASAASTFWSAADCDCGGARRRGSARRRPRALARLCPATAWHALNLDHWQGQMSNTRGSRAAAGSLARAERPERVGPSERRGRADAVRCACRGFLHAAIKRGEF